MANRIGESRNSPLIPQNSSVALSSGTPTAQACTKLVIVFTVSGNLTIKTLDGTSVTFTAMPVGYYTFDLQFDTVTWGGTATAAGFYTQ